MPHPSTALDALRRPVHPDTREALDAAWTRLPTALRGETQFLGRQYAGCGATVGAMPRCDFACRGCYLGSDANRIPALPMDALRGQLETLRDWLGEGGNLQLTDGEVALRDPDELVELVRMARSIGLVPMLMTHGEGVRRDPALLHRLMIEGGLREISIHVDTTQRGRRDPRYRHAHLEEELMPLRDEFAALVRDARRLTGRPLKLASTVTVTRKNLGEVDRIVAWATRNADVLSILSFQPVADVGRTERAISQPIDVDELWSAIEKGAGLTDEGVRERHGGSLGHPACTRHLQGVVVAERDVGERFVPLRDGHDARQRAFIARALDTWGGLTFRLDTRGTVIARALGALLRAPRLALLEAPRRALDVLRRADERRVWKRLGSIVRGRTHLHYLNLVSHHFMSPAELDTPLGRERLDQCVFRVAVDGETVPMCRLNAGGLRDRLYAQWAEAGQ